MSVSEKLYRVLLLAYPRGYRERYAEPMAQLFRDRLRSVQSCIDLVALWSTVLRDWTVSVPRQHWETALARMHRSPLEHGARRCLFFARFEASSFSRGEITPEHLLLGVLRERSDVVPLSSHEPIVRMIEASEPAGRRQPPMEDLRLSDESRRVVATATKLAGAAGRDSVSLADLIEGILREENTLAARLLRQHLAR